MIHQFFFTNADQIKIAVDLGSDLIAGQSEVKLVDPSFRPSAHALFSGRGRHHKQTCRREREGWFVGRIFLTGKKIMLDIRQKSQSCRFGQPETLYELAIVELFKGILAITEVPWSVVLGQI